MSDKEKIIKGLECCCSATLYDCEQRCPYGYLFKSNRDCMSSLLLDTFALLKEQEPVKPCVAVDTWICPKCGHTLESQNLIDDKENPQVLVHELYSFCPNCGKAVKLE